MNDSVHYGAYDSSFADTTEDANFTHDHTNPVRTVLVTSD